MNDAMKTIEGWYCLHDFRHFNWPKWKKSSKTEQIQALEEWKILLKKWKICEENEQGSHSLYTIIGQKADLLHMLLRPTMKEIHEAEKEFLKCKIANFTLPAYSFVSVIEKSSYSEMSQDPFNDPIMRTKLFPRIPKNDYVCFYPMSKLRGEKANWFMLPKEERKKLMYEHIETGKPYSGSIKRIITGAVGFDDFEWGVSLFSDDVLQFKKLIYHTRFDEVSAVYGLFGSFYIGQVLLPVQIDDYFLFNE